MAWSYAMLDWKLPFSLAERGETRRFAKGPHEDNHGGEADHRRQRDADAGGRDGDDQELPSQPTWVYTYTMGVGKDAN